jgi:hypothetical protein
MSFILLIFHTICFGRFAFKNYANKYWLHFLKCIAALLLFFQALFCLFNIKRLSLNF